MYAICQIFIKVRKFKKIAIFQIPTFELGENIRKQNKTCSETNGCLCPPHVVETMCGTTSQ